ncbi:MAG TPA: hypothetical protein P5526_10775 [Anaerolineae bacterium]|nr:hypothetical protein [Anaerolineales bacterium]HRV92636.1 hypothetical protein [Anaerolineae bacterium]
MNIGSVVKQLNQSGKTFTFSIIILSLIFISCTSPIRITRHGGNPNNLIIGKWAAVSGPEYMAEFLEDGTFIETREGGRQNVGTYVISEDSNTIEISAPNMGSASGPFSVNKERLNLFGLTKFRRADAGENDTGASSGAESSPSAEGGSSIVPLLAVAGAALLLVAVVVIVLAVGAVWLFRSR